MTTVPDIPLTGTSEITATITREPSTDAGTFGKLVLVIPTSGGSITWECHTLELPWKDNRTKLSCIPAGTYTSSPVRSPKFGDVYGVHNVPGRSAILIHAGNYGGDIEKGLKSDIEGCILLGMGRGTLTGQPALTMSRDAIARFREHVKSQLVTLVIK